MDKDIRIYGTLLNYTTDDKIAYAKQVFDEEFEGGTKQSEINKRVRAISTNGTKTVVDSDLQVTSGHKITAPKAEFNGASIGNGTIIDLVVTDSAEFDCNIRPGESNITIGTQDAPWHDGYFEDIHVDGWVYTDFVKVLQEVVAGNVIADYRVASQEIGTDKITSKLGGGDIVVSGSLIPEVTNTITLGDVNHLWKGLYVNDIHAANLNGVDLADFFDEVETLIGTGEGSISKMIDDKIAALINDAPDSLDTLKEISDWISSHQNDASAMNSAIQSLQSTVDGFSNKISTDKIYANQYYIGYDKDGNTEYYGLISYNNGSLTIGGSNVDDVTIQPSNLYARDIHANNIYTKDEIDEMFSSVDPTIPSRLSVDQIVATGAEFRSADIGHGSITDLVVTDSATFDCNIRPGDGSLTVGTQENPWYEVYTTTLHADNVYTKDEINTLIQNAVDSLTQQIEDLQDRVHALENQSSDDTPSGDQETLTISPSTGTLSADNNSQQITLSIPQQYNTLGDNIDLYIKYSDSVGYVKTEGGPVSHSTNEQYCTYYYLNPENDDDYIDLELGCRAREGSSSNNWTLSVKNFGADTTRTIDYMIVPKGKFELSITYRPTFGSNGGSVTIVDELGTSTINYEDSTKTVTHSGIISLPFVFELHGSDNYTPNSENINPNADVEFANVVPYELAWDGYAILTVNNPMYNNLYVDFNLEIE